jgi:ABC-2 type transport system ATP-binding protein
MSKGTRQKVGVVQAFMHRPRVLILDEPTSGLDPLVQRAFVELLEDSRREGAAVLLSSHVMHEVETLATHVTIILRGRQVLVDEIASLRRRVQRTLVFDFDHDVRTDQFEGCAHVVSVTGGGRTVTCSVSGPETEVLRTAAALGAHTVNSSEPSLEDLFYSVTGAGDVR